MLVRELPNVLPDLSRLNQRRLNGGPGVRWNRGTRSRDCGNVVEHRVVTVQVLVGGLGGVFVPEYGPRIRRPAREGVGEGEGEEEVTRADFCSHAAKRSEPIAIGAIRGIFIRTT